MSKSSSKQTQLAQRGGGISPVEIFALPRHTPPKTKTAAHDSREERLL